jgi:hypothetical protein
MSDEWRFGKLINCRHSGRGGITISTRDLKGVTYQAQWRPTAGSSKFVRRQLGARVAAAVIGAGNSFGTLGPVLQARGQATVRGADAVSTSIWRGPFSHTDVSQSVGVAGWTMGGGHGPYTSVYGLGCDNALEFQVVLTNGTIATTNENSYPDLFWALRGGGGGTFGVTTKVTLRTFAKPSMGSAIIRVGGARNAYLGAMAHFFAMTPNMTDFGMTGYPTMSTTSYMGSLSAPGKSSAQVQTFMRPIVAKMKSYGATVTFTGGIGKIGLKKRDDEFSLPFTDPLKAYYTERARRLEKRQGLNFKSTHNTPVDDMGSRLLSRNLLRDGNQAAIKSMLANLKGHLLPYGNVGGQVTRNAKLDIGLNPSWRKAVMHLIAINYAISSNVRAMDKLSINHSAYWNECWDSESDWKTTFFGPPAHYQKLLAIKERYDPTNTLWCHPCVGGDVFVSRKDGYLYVNPKAAAATPSASKSSGSSTGIGAKAKSTGISAEVKSAANSKSPKS